MNKNSITLEWVIMVPQSYQWCCRFITREKHLAEAIDSILAQTFADFELIIIDDGSTDGSLRILQEYQKRDARIRLISRENRNWQLH